jgi:hypothetical protein
MTLAEVETILGARAGDYRPARHKNPGHFVSTMSILGTTVKESGLSQRDVQNLDDEDLRLWVLSGRVNRPSRITTRYWWGERWGIRVVLDENGRVIRHELLEMVPPEPPHDLFRRLKWYVGL